MRDHSQPGHREVNIGISQDASGLVLGQPVLNPLNLIEIFFIMS